MKVARIWLFYKIDNVRTVSPGPLLFSSNTGTDPLKNHKVTKPALYVGPSLVLQRNAI